MATTAPAASEPTASTPAARFQPPRRFDNGAEWLDALGGVPMSRVIFDPWPGTATERDLLEFVERDKRLCELIDGTLVEKPVGLTEATIASNLSGELFIHNKRTDHGVISGADSTLRMASSNRIRLPDLCFFTKDRLPGGVLPREAVPTLAPDLAVEVLSESNTRTEMDQKLREYFGSGTRLVWYIDPPTRTVAVYHAPGEPTAVLAEADTLDGGDVLPGFTLAVAEVFRGVPEQA